MTWISTRAAGYSARLCRRRRTRVRLDPSCCCWAEEPRSIDARGGKYGSALNAAVICGFWDIVQILLDGGATPDCGEVLQPSKEWLQLVREEHGGGAVERYRRFCEVEEAKRRGTASQLYADQGEIKEV